MLLFHTKDVSSPDFFGATLCGGEMYVYVIHSGYQLVNLYKPSGEYVKMLNLKLEDLNGTYRLLFCSGCFCVGGREVNVDRYTKRYVDLVYFNIRTGEKFVTNYRYEYVVPSAYELTTGYLPSKFTPTHHLVEDTDSNWLLIGDSPEEPLQSFDKLRDIHLTYVTTKQTSYVYDEQAMKYTDAENGEVVAVYLPYNYFIYDRKFGDFDAYKRKIVLRDAETGKTEETLIVFPEDFSPSDKFAVFENEVILASLCPGCQHITVARDLPIAFTNMYPTFLTPFTFGFATFEYYYALIVPTLKAEDGVLEKLLLHGVIKRRNVRILRSKYTVKVSAFCNASPRGVVSKLIDFSFFIF